MYFLQTTGGRLVTERMESLVTSDNRTSSYYDEQPQRRPTSGRGRRRGRGATANTGNQANNRPPVSYSVQQGHCNQTDRSNYFHSENADFKDIVKGINQGARLQHANENWDQLPKTIDRAIDRVTALIRPPLTDHRLTDKIAKAAVNFKFAITHAVKEHITDKYKIAKAAVNFKFAITHAVKEHITDKYAGVCCHLASVDDRFR